MDNELFTLVTEKINDDNATFSRGSRARFIRIDTRRGFKFYREKLMAHSTRLYQVSAHAVGMAPEILSEVVEVNFNGDSCWGYMTETAVETCSDWHNGMHRLGEANASNGWRVMWKKAEAAAKKLRNLTNIDVVWDLSPNNFGLSPTGDIWFFDFSHRTDNVDLDELAAI